LWQDLHQSGVLSLADIGDVPSEAFQQRQDLGIRLGRPGADQGQHPCPDHLAVAAHRGGDEADASIGQHLTRGRGSFRGHGGTVHDMSGCPVGVGEQPVEHLVEVDRGRDHGEHNVAVREVRRVIDHRDAERGQRLGFGARAVPHGDIDPGLAQALCQGEAHPPGPDPTDAELCAAHRQLLFRG